MKFRLTTLFLSLIILLAAQTSVLSQQIYVTEELDRFGSVEFVQSEVIIKFRDGVLSSDKSAVKNALNAELKEDIPFIGAELWSIREYGTMNDVLTTWEDHPDIEYIEPNFAVRIPDYEVEEVFEDEASLMDGVIPDDPQFNQQWALRNTQQQGGVAGADISAPQAWEFTTGSDDIIIAIIDSGINYNHPDLAGNMWTDEDGFFGRNYVAGQASHNPMDDDGHGSHVAGSVGAVGNNGVGITGVMWNVRLMALRAVTSSSGNLAHIISAIGYAVENGAQISNNSYGFETSNPNPPSALFNAISNARDAGHLFVTAAGNSAANNDNRHFFPANIDLDNVITVGNSSPSDTRFTTSNFGNNSVHLFAPGRSIRSTGLGSNYFTTTGTSMASPHVAGIAGLVLAFYPDADYTFIRDRILDNVDPIDALSNISITGGRANAANAILVNDETPPADVSDLSADYAGHDFVSLSWTAVGFSDMEGRAETYDIRYSTSPITSGNFDSANQVENTNRPKVAGEDENFIVGGLDPDTQYYFALKVADYFGNTSEMSNSVSISTGQPASFTLNPNALDISVEIDTQESFSLDISSLGPGALRYTFASELPEGTGSKESPNPVNANDSRFRISHRADGSEQGSPVLFGAGGPDEFGYIWMDNYESAGLTFNWIDISGTGSETSISDEINGNTAVNLPFSFPFYGDDFDEIYVSVNGFISFSEIPASGAPVNFPMPADLDNAMHKIAPFWNNLNAEDGAVYTHHDADSGFFIVQWDNLRLNNSDPEDGTFTFQLLLHESGNITFQYQQMSGDSERSTVGIQSGENALQVAYNTPLLQDFYAVNFSQTLPSWAVTDPASGVIPSGTDGQASLLVDTDGMVNGIYSTELVMLSNDADQHIRVIPVSLEVTGGVPNSVIEETELVFDLIFIGYPETREVVIRNVGRADLEFSSITIDNDAYSFEFGESMSVPALSEKPILVTYDPDESGTATATMTLSSNDPESAQTIISLTGEAIGAPVLSLDRDEIEVFLDSNDLRTEQLAIGNNGESSLTYEISFEDGRPNWIILPSGSGEVGGESSENVSVIFRGNEAPGVYTTNMILSTNDPESPEIVIPLTLFIDQETSADGFDDIPVSFELNQNYPNPFNPVTQITYSLPENADVLLEVYNIQGQLVATLVSQHQASGRHQVSFDASALSSGIYIYRLHAGDFVKSRKMMLVK